MAGLAYIYQGQQISFDDPEYNDPQFGTMRFNMNVGGSKVKHGFTSDISASQYCSLKFRINSSQTARIGRQRTRSRVSSEPEHTETWSGTGYVSKTATVEEVIGDRTIWTGALSSMGSSRTSHWTHDWNASSASYYTTEKTPLVETTTSYLSNTSRSSTLETISSVLASGRTDGYQVWYRSALVSNTDYYYSNSTQTRSTYVLRVTKLSSASRTQDDGMLHGYGIYETISRFYTYGEFETTIQPQHTLTHTATFETLHNYNL